MWELIVSELTQFVQEFSRGFARLLPRLIVLVIIAAVGWLIAYLLKHLVRSILRLAKFDRLSENAGASQLLAKAALPSSTELFSRFVFWVAWLGFILLGIDVLGIFGLDDEIARFFLFLPRMFVALFIMFFGLLAASFFSRAVLLPAMVVLDAFVLDVWAPDMRAVFTGLGIFLGSQHFDVEVHATARPRERS